MRLRSIAFGLLIAYSVPALAQRGSASSSHKKKHHKASRKKHPSASAGEESLPPVPQGQEGTPDSTDPTRTPAESGAAAGSLGMDLSGPGKAPPPPPDKAAAPTMTFDAVDVSGKSGDRQ